MTEDDDERDLDDDVVADAGALDDDARCYAEACAAFCRGRLSLPSTSTDAEAIAAGVRAGLRLHRFKRARVLPRVQAVLGALRGFAPSELLDVGTGRGVFLWPLLETLPWLAVTCVDVREDRVGDLRAVRDGGIERLEARVASAAALPFADRSFDVVTALEVLEHVDDEHACARELVRVARRAVLVTVPSQPDDNPEHVRLFTKERLVETFTSAGAARVRVDGVPGHFVVVVSS